MKKFISFVLLILSIWLAPLGQRTAEAVSITIIGEWNLSVSVSDIVDGKSEYNSAPNQVRLSVSGTTGPWKVYVRKDDSNWNSNFVLKVRKTSGRTKPIVTVRDTDTEFFTGDKDHNFNIQLIVEGVSIAVAPDTYTATVIYTITEE